MRALLEGIAIQFCWADSASTKSSIENIDITTNWLVDTAYVCVYFAGLFLYYSGFFFSRCGPFELHTRKKFIFETLVTVVL